MRIKQGISIRSIKALSALLGIVVLTATALAQQTKRDEGIELYRADDFAKAASRVTEATAADKHDYQAWLFLAAAYKNLGKEKEAIKAFERSRAIKKHDAPKYDQPAKITSKRTGGIKGEDSSPPSDYAVAVEFRADSTIGIIIPYLKFFPERKQAIIDDIKKIKFDPAVQNGKPVTVIFVLEYSFSSY